MTSTYDPEYMMQTLATKEWIWLMNPLGALNVPVTNAAMLCDYKAGIDIAYNHTIDDWSKQIDIAYTSVCENIESAWISLLQIELAKNLANISNKDLCT
jgi:hypothetical protein